MFEPFEYIQYTWLQLLFITVTKDKNINICSQITKVIDLYLSFRLNFCSSECIKALGKVIFLFDQFPIEMEV